MAFTATVLMLIAGSFHVDGGTLADYTPHITHWDLEGKITTTTFVLEQPRCNFTDIGEDDRIWLLVARSSAYEKFTLPEAPQNLSYQEFSKNSYYMTMDTSVLSYPCATSPQEITVLRVGNETSCINTSKPDCNGPLPDPGPYRVRFIAIRPNGTMFPSQWSDEIRLIQGRDYTTIKTKPRWRSRGMIAITSILSILFAILLASFIAALIYKYSDICGKADIMSVRDTATVTRYTTHHMYDHPTSKS
ncbi:uroplakin-3b-like protein 1 [Eublepharis macularius]|uniref:Uroplakin-3b-like protein 1 n=1 Tax=Eublepharis macularius TaxID=481883 RepID=A0AA97LIW1_EUBMA|nr:uroplakin-3b-like protein 1 [Eublepharis macularius]